MAKSNSSWIDVRAGLDDIIIREHQQAYTPFTDFTDLEMQSPQMIILIGEENKSQAMQNLRFGTTTKPQRVRNGGGEIRLLIDDSTLKTSAPILYADCELHTDLCFKRLLAGRAIGYTVSRPLTWRNRMPHSIEPLDLANLLYAKLLSPFGTIVCMFAEDLKGLGAIARTLASWLVNLNNSPSDLPPHAHPQIIVLTKADNYASFDEAAASQEFNQLVAKEVEQRSGLLVERVKGRLPKAKVNEIVASQFGTIKVMPLPPMASSNRTWRCLRDRIIQASHDVHLQRLNLKVAFSTNHFKALFHLAIDHFCNHATSPFSFIKASRIHNPVSPQMSQHILAFLRPLRPSQMLEFAVPTIASALVLDSLPPGMHHFDPSSVFRQHYLQVCEEALVQTERSGQEVFDIVKLTAAIESQFCQTFDTIDKGTASPLTSHQETLFRFREDWAEIHSNTTCLVCQARKPENSLLCGHSICDPCAIMNGSSSQKNPWTFQIESCPLCSRHSGTVIRLKPPTAGVRVLSIDGGGVRGISSVMWLKELEALLRLPMSIQEHFDIAIGTSSGGLIVLGLYHNKWSVNECAAEFQNLARLAFHSKTPFSLSCFSRGLFRRAREMILSFITDSRYGSAGITKAVQAAFGERQQLYGNSSGTKIGVTATTTENSSTVIFSNYSGPDRSIDCGYRVLRPEDAENGIHVWEIARATSAAPPFFKSYKGYHDGGLGGHNNPVKLALWEQESIWQRESKQPDIVVSVGTGSRVDSSGSDDGTVSWISQLFIPRLLRSFMMLLDGQKTWVETLNSVPQQYRPRYHRLNVSFYGEEPQIDQVECMRELVHLVRSHSASNLTDLSRCADNMMASLFYFELYHPPVWDRYNFKCKGRILCRLDADTRALHALVLQLKEKQAQFYLHSQDRIPCVDRDAYKRVRRGEPFERQVEFEVTSKNEQIDFKIDGITQRPRSISNFPYTISDIESDQGFHLVFGRPDHKRRLDPMIFAQKSKRRRYI